MPEVERLDILVVGAGLSGVAAAYHLQHRLPKKRVAVLEARDSVGGTWDLFKYPGVRSDSDMQTMGFSFRPWTGDQTLASGAAIAEYIKDTVSAFGLERFIRYSHRVVRASWLSADASWMVEVDQAGVRIEIASQFLIMCTGYYKYSVAHQPWWKGIEDFRGRLVHPQFWPDDIETDGRSIVVVGSGATAVTLVPVLAETASHVTLLQRSPSYIVSRPRRDPIAQALARWLPKYVVHSVVRWKNIAQFIMLYRFARWRPRAAARSMIAKVEEEIGHYCDPKDFNPRYRPWDQRICFAADGDLFKAIRHGQATIVTDTIDHFTSEGIHLSSGKDLNADIVVSATGLEMALLDGIAVYIDGRLVKLGNCVSYKNVMLSGVPNLALSIGYINASWTLRCELTAIYVCRLLARMDKRGEVECRPLYGPKTGDETCMIALNSNFVRRAANQLPKQGRSAPWRVSLNFVTDALATHLGRLDDGVRFVRKSI